MDGPAETASWPAVIQFIAELVFIVILVLLANSSEDDDE